MRVIRWGDWVVNKLLDDVPHCQLVFSIPKILRNAFARNRKLLGKISLCAAQTIKEVIGAAFEDRDIQPGIIVSIQTFGEYARWNPHVHVLTTNGGFDSKGLFHYLPEFPVDTMKIIFREKVFSIKFLLLKPGSCQGIFSLIDFDLWMGIRCTISDNFIIFFRFKHPQSVCVFSFSIYFSKYIKSVFGVADLFDNLECVTIIRIDIQLNIIY